MEFQIGKILRKKRLMEDISQKELAQAIGVTHLQISRWEKNKSVPDGHNLLRVMRYLGIAPAELSFLPSPPCNELPHIPSSPPVTAKG